MDIGLQKIKQTEWYAVYKRIAREPGVPRYAVVDGEAGKIIREFITQRAAENWIYKQEDKS